MAYRYNTPKQKKFLCVGWRYQTIGAGNVICVRVEAIVSAFDAKVAKYKFCFHVFDARFAKVYDPIEQK